MAFLGLALGFVKKHWLIILVALAVLFAVEKYHSMEKQILKDKATIERVEGENKLLKEIQAEQVVGNANQDIGARAQSSTNGRQQSTREKINNVPTTSNDKPFSDPGLLARASILRDHQTASYPEK